MTRVTDNSAAYAVNYSIAKAKSKLEDLQVKGSNLKTIQKPSDNPAGSMEVLSIRSRKTDGQQYTKNAAVARAQLEYTENALSDLTDVLARAKELAVSQSSQTYNSDARKSVAEEVNQLYWQALAIANKRMGSRYIFGGTKTLTRPFDDLGRYHGDNGKIQIEVSKDRYLPINMTGYEVTTGAKEQDNDNNVDLPPRENMNEGAQRTLASEDIEKQIGKNTNAAPTAQDSILGHSAELFADLKSFYNALQTDNPDIVRNLLEKFDEHIDTSVRLRTRIGSLINSLSNTETHNERDLIMQQDYISKLEDADVMELYTDLQKQQGILEASYRTGANTLNKNLLQFIG